MTVTYHTGHVLDHVRALPDASVDLVTTSPPFLALRDYNGQEGQWGSEPDPASFLDHLLELTTELRRVLAPHGSIAIELGDTFSGASGWSSAGDDTWSGGPDRGRQSDWRSRPAKPSGGTGWPAPKSLCGTPTLFAWSLAYGRNLLRPDHTITPWLVRNVIVWARNNPPVGALGDKVRPATSYITVACPSPRRWFDLDAVRTAPSPRTIAGRSEPNHLKAWAGARGDRETNDFIVPNPAGAPPLDHWHDQPDGDLLWLINTQGSSLAHYAMWPPKLVERLILSMCPAQVCRVCGEPRRRITGPAEYHRTDSDRVPARLTKLDGSRPSEGVNQHTRPDGANTSVIAHRPTLGWSDCACGPNCIPATWETVTIPASYRDDGKLIATARRERVMVDPGSCDGSHYRPGHVLDPFAGTGTSLAVADIHGRDATGIDLDPANPKLYPTRYAQCWAALKPDAGVSPVTDHGEQLNLMEHA